ncbi:MAG: lysophospholipid acyltransferase family protein [Xanthomonadales bacterium]|nr:lysophospholipid acyltransferase family protein [Xanthomonadales bacterium]
MWILKSLGWTVNNSFPEVRKCVVIAAPHTSNWDFILGIVAAKAIRLEPRWIGKHTIFRWPVGWFFRAIGGIPIRRGEGLNYIDQLTDLFTETDRLVLGLAPEGTRSRTDHWKTGFHHIARAAGVPVLMAYFDYPRKSVGIEQMFYPSDDIEADFEHIRAFYAGHKGKNPEQASLIRVRDKTA